MASETFQHRYFIPATPTHIYQHLSEPMNYIGLSPLVEQVDNIASHTDSQGRTVYTYQSVEVFHFLGFIRYPNRIRVKMILTRPDEQMVSEVDSPFNVHVLFEFDLESADGGTWIIETVTATMPVLIRGFVVQQAKAVQMARAEELKRRMQSPD